MRYPSLQYSRALAAFAVVLHHVNGKFVAPHYYGDRIPEWFAFGQLGVDFFFVLSGFIITQSLSGRPLAGQFVLNRLLRIFPPFWLVFFPVLLVAKLTEAYLHSPVTSSLQELFMAGLLLPQAQPPVIGVAWTLHHELLFYALASLWLVLPRVATLLIRHLPT